jgi:hypothetical protein
MENAGAIRFLIAPKLDLAPTRRDGTCVGLQVSTNDFQEGRLAGTVLADKLDDLSLVEVQSYLGKRRLSGESLADSLEVKDATDGGFLRWGLLNMGK